MAKVYLGLGSNLGNREKYLLDACKMLTENAGVITLASAIYETQAQGFTTRRKFLNACISLLTEIQPGELMDVVLKIEHFAGRQREDGGYCDRTIDIDILFYDEIVLKRTFLTIPHPHLHERMFVLKPLSDIAPDLIHPVLKKTISELMKSIKDRTGIQLYKHPVLKNLHI